MRIRIVIGTVNKTGIGKPARTITIEYPSGDQDQTLVVEKIKRDIEQKVFEGKYLIYPNAHVKKPRVAAIITKSKDTPEVKPTEPERTEPLSLKELRKANKAEIEQK